MLGPFRVVAAPCHIKASNRQPLAVGELLAVDFVETDTFSAPGAAAALINSVGLTDLDRNGLPEHSTAPEHMWLSEKGRTTGSIVLNLKDAGKIGQIHVWNYNDKYYTCRGVKQADVSVWTESDGWKKIIDDHVFESADGDAGYDEPTVIPMGDVVAARIRLDDLHNLGDPEYVGLSEIRVYAPRGPEPILLEPKDGAQSCATDGLQLVWTPGLNADAQRIYVGTDDQALRLITTLNNGSARAAELTGLKPATVYHWRVDSVLADGTVAAGDTRSFTTGKLVAWWKFDESEGGWAHDSAGGELHGRLIGEPVWRPDGGRFGGAIELDGKDDYVDMGAGKEFDLTEAITISSWLKVNTFDKQFQALVTKGDNSWRLHRMDVTDGLSFAGTGVKSNQPNTWGSRAVGDVNVNDGQWRHAAAVFTGSRMLLYIDGTLDDACDTAGKISSSQHPVMVGENAQQRGRLWNGMVDDVRIYSFALSAEQVKMLYDGKSPALETTGEIKIKGGSKFRNLPEPTLYPAEEEAPPDRR
ncbi:MAG TPA: hypothetical protein P5279_07055 [Anaerohalosphaeraceae bacterium]|nr:hypothetical protein [Anaerohalosphaeraceae bacterium]HRT50233.1 hypothetical protein [Anaerohalosphaeraceae bacterium]HRT86164.1 hypothetical protein [Anaerohalosphaeraceae bacterium]